MAAEEKSGYGTGKTNWAKLTKPEGLAMADQMEKEMQKASRQLEFERAAELRDIIFELRERFGASKKAKK